MGHQDEDRDRGNMESEAQGNKEEYQETEAERRYRKILAISRVSAAVSELWHLNTILKVALDNVLEVMNGDIGGILLLDEQTQTLSYRVWHGLSDQYAKEMRIKLGEGIAGRVAQTGKSILLEDISADPRAARPDLVRTEGLKAFISVPLRARRVVMGVINVASHLPHRFTEADMYLLHSIGDQLGVAVEGAKLSEHMRASRMEIAKLEEEKERFLRFLSIAAHDLKAPLTAIQGFLWVMLGGYTGEINPKQKNLLERSTVRIGELLSLISDLLDIPRIEAGQIVQDITQVPLRDIIKTACEELAGMAKEKGLTLTVEVPESLPEIRGSAPRLKQVVTNLVGNAIAYTREGGVTIRAKETGDEVRVEVADTGIGIPSQDIPHLFEDFFRASNVETKGTGLGLSISKRIIAAHGGRIWVECPCPETNKGTRFVFTLPRRY